VRFGIAAHLPASQICSEGNGKVGQATKLKTIQGFRDLGIYTVFQLNTFNNILPNKLKH